MNNLIALKQLRTGELGDFIDGYATTFMQRYSGFLEESGSLVNYRFNVNTGISGERFNFDQPFSGIPFMQGTIISPNNSGYSYLLSLSSIDTSGFYASYSAVLSGEWSTGYYLDILAGTPRSINYVQSENTINTIQYYSGITTGTYQQRFDFNPPFSLKPVVTTTIEIPDNGTGLYLNNISGVSTSGFYSIWSGPILQTGYLLHVTASY
jgi:hypothetical protein